MVSLCEKCLPDREKDAALLRAALEELVACKDLKDSLPSLVHDLSAWGEAHADYQRRKQVAWGMARAALAFGTTPAH